MFLLAAIIVVAAFVAPILLIFGQGGESSALNLGEREVWTLIPLSARIPGFRAHVRIPAAAENGQLLTHR